MKLARREVVSGLLALLVAAACVRLGVWQLNRLEQRQARNAAVEQGLAVPPALLTADRADSLAAGPAPLINRRWRARGEFDPRHPILLRGRSLAGRPGVHLVVPLRLAGSSRVLLVDRGWLGAPDAATPPRLPAPEAGPQTVVGWAQELPNVRAGGVPLTATVSGTRLLSLQRLDSAALREQLPYPVLPVVLQELPSAELAEPPVRVPPPETSAGPHLGYAIQWFSFAAIALGGWAILVWRGRSRPAAP